MNKSASVKRSCVYCGDKGDSRDHVPPKSFFARPRPSDLITVPSCKQCNGGASQDEEYFLACYMLGVAGATDAGRRLWDEKLARMYARRGILRAITRAMRPVRVRTPDGTGYTIALEADLDRLKSTAIKVAKGLYSFEFNEPLSSTARVVCRPINTEERVRKAQPLITQVRPGGRNWPGVFEYRCGRVRENPHGSLWFMLFFERVLYGVVTAPVGTRSSQPSRSDDR